MPRVLVSEGQGDVFALAVERYAAMTPAEREELLSLWADLASRYHTSSAIDRGVATGALLALAAIVHADSPK